MKLLVKAAALCVIAMPLFAADMTTNTTTMGGTTASQDCSTMTGDAQAKCMKDMKNNCMNMPSGTQKNDCMAKYQKMMDNMGTTGTTTGTTGKTMQ